MSFARSAWTPSNLSVFGTTYSYQFELSFVESVYETYEKKFCWKFVSEERNDVYFSGESRWPIRDLSKGDKIQFIGITDLNSGKSFNAGYGCPYTDVGGIFEYPLEHAPKRQWKKPEQMFRYLINTWFVVIRSSYDYTEDPHKLEAMKDNATQLAISNTIEFLGLKKTWLPHPSWRHFEVL